MSGRDRLNIFPSRANFVLMKHRVVGAQKGLSLLKKKRDALDYHLKQFSAQLRQEREKLEGVMNEAIFSLAKANFLAADFKPASVIKPLKADAYVRVTSNKIVGMNVPVLEPVLEKTNALHLTGLASGGTQVRIVREKFQEALKLLIEVGSMQYSSAILDKAVKQTNMRVNALEHVVVPRYLNTQAFIGDELDELEREDFYRMKHSQAKKRKKKAELAKLMTQGNAAEIIEPVYDFTNTHISIPTANILVAKASKVMRTSRRTIAKITSKTIVMETEEEKPLLWKTTDPGTLTIQRRVEVEPKVVVTYSASESDSSE